MYTPNTYIKHDDILMYVKKTASTCVSAVILVAGYTFMKIATLVDMYAL